jgi:hypothetical protein
MVLRSGRTGLRLPPRVGKTGSRTGSRPGNPGDARGGIGATYGRLANMAFIIDKGISE